MEAFSALENQEVAIRLGVFLGVLALLILGERLRPRRPLSIKRSARWLGNLSLAVLDSLLLRLVFQAGAVGMAVFAAQQEWGVLNVFEIPYWSAVLLSVILLDLAIWFQHVLFHAVPMFWRLHRVHHADLDFDVTTGLRFHPFEILLSMLIKFCAIVVLGPPVAAVIIFEVLLNATSMFNHSNLHLPEWLDRKLRWILVTPDMHRVHHSIESTERDRNFGFNLPWWDRLFGTYVAQPALGHTKMTVGLTDYREYHYCVSPLGLLTLPFAANRGGQ